MDRKIRNAFQSVRADEALIKKTTDFLNRRRVQSSQQSRGFFLLRLGMAVAAVLLIIGLAGYQMFYIADAYVSIDINPSVEVTLNKFDRVIDTYAFNEEGAEILAQLNLKGKQFDQAVNLLIDAVNTKGYFVDTALVAVTVQTERMNKEEQLSKSLQTTITDGINTNKITADIEVTAISGEIRQYAHDCHISPARYLAILELMEVDEAATLEAYSHHSIRQIRQRTQACMTGEEHKGGGRERENGGRNHHR